MKHSNLANITNVNKGDEEEVFYCNERMEAIETKYGQKWKKWKLSREGDLY